MGDNGQRQEVLWLGLRDHKVDSTPHIYLGRLPGNAATSRHGPRRAFEASDVSERRLPHLQREQAVQLTGHIALRR